MKKTNVEQIVFFMNRMMMAGALFMAEVASQAADTWYVTTNGAGFFDGSAWTNAFSNIQHGINASTADDTVLVSNGVYEVGGTTNFPDGSLLTNRVAITKAITIRSANNDPTNTIIKGAWASDGQTNGMDAVRGVYMVANSKLIGFTITNGATLTNASSRGGGIWSEAISAIVSNCIIAGNATTGAGGPNGGGGVYRTTCYNCDILGNYATTGAGGGADGASLYDSVIAFNSAHTHGGGAWNSSISNCMVISNRSILAGYRGGGVYCGNIHDSTLAYNSATDGAGYCGRPGDSYTIRNCLIYGNQGDGAAMGRSSKMESCTVVGNSRYGVKTFSDATWPQITNTIANCVVYSNATNWIEVAQGGGVSTIHFTNTCTTLGDKNPAAFLAAGNTTNNPILIDFGTGYGTNHIAGNYRLQPASPCVNRGLYQGWMAGGKDRDGNPRIRNRVVDMGCYETFLSGSIYSIR